MTHCQTDMKYRLVPAWLRRVKLQLARWAVSVPSPDCPRALTTYICFIALANFAWEMLYLPLYTIWTTGTLGEQAFAVAHCPAEKS